jgi:Methane oxygenase PmoA
MKAAWSVLVALTTFSTLHAQQESKTVQIKPGKEAVEFFLGDELVTRYHTKGYAKPIFWPINAPGGVPLTRDWPMISRPANKKLDDHTHQKSGWFCHGDVIPEGIEIKSKIRDVKGVDFWSEAKGHGEIICTSVGQPKIDPGHGSLTTVNEWRTAEGMKILDETRTIHLYDLGKARLLVVQIDMHASVCPITFGDTKEGAFGIRIHESLGNPEKTGKGTIRNADGKIGEKECWGYTSAWCDYSGPIKDKVVGLTLLDDPKNPHPACWHVRGYGLMAANPFGRGGPISGFPAMKGRTDLVRLDKGAHLQLRYGMLLHEGDAASGQVAENYARFVKLRAKE